MNRNLFSGFVLAIITISLYAQDPNILWQRTIGGSSSDVLWSVRSTPDGGLVLGGTSSSNSSGEKNENSMGGDDFWVLKLNSSGVIEWQNTIGGSENDYLYALEPTLDGGYILGGLSYSNISGDKTENSIGSADYWIVKIDSSGTIQWQNTIGGGDIDVLTSIVVNLDGTYLLSGYSASNISSDKSENAIGTGSDFWIIKIDGSGNIIWDNTIGGTNLDLAATALQTSDGGFIIAGPSFSNISGDKTENTNGLQDYWIVKLNGSGTIQWQNTIGGSSNDLPRSIIETNDGGFLIGGHSDSNISGDKNENSQGLDDYWILKLDNTGNIQWQNTIGGSNTDICYSVAQKNNGNFLIGGYSDSGITGDKTEANIGAQDYWIVELDTSGNIIGQKNIGGAENEIFTSLLINDDGELLLGGASDSNISGDKTENSRGGNDFWIIKHNSILNIAENPFSKSISIYPNPTKNSLQLNTKDKTIDQVNIYTITGSKILQLEPDTVSPSVDVSSLASGVYYVQLYSGKNVAVKKFVKE